MYEFWCIFMGFLLGAVAGIIFLAYMTPTEYQKQTVICEQAGGTMHDGLCVVGDQVIKIHLRNNQ